MALKIRLSRGGAKKRPFYRIVVADTRAPRDGRFIERLGTYNPMVPRDHPERIVLKEDRVKHWLAAGATPSDRVARFLGQANIIPAPPIPHTPKKSQPKAKAQQRLQERAEREAAARKATEKAAAEAETPAEEAAAAPAEEVKPEEAEAGEKKAEGEEKKEKTPEGEPAEAGTGGESEAGAAEAGEAPEEKS